MYVQSLLVLFLLTVGAKCSDDCNQSPDSNVSLTVSDIDVCPSQLLTAFCTVKRETIFTVLKWDCENVAVLCTNNKINDFMCGFGKVYNVMQICNCDDSVIVSEASFLAPTAGGSETLSCSSGAEKASIDISVQELKGPNLISVDTSISDGVCNIVVTWNETDSNIGDIEYVLSVSNSSTTYNMTTTTATMANVEVPTGDNYCVTLNSQRCLGNLTSNHSRECHVSCSAVTPTDAAQGTETNISAVVGGVIGGISFLVLVITVVLLLRSKKNIEETDDGSMQGTLESISGKSGIKLSAREKGNFVKVQEDKHAVRSAVGAIYVEANFLYYSCKVMDNDSYVLRKCNRDGKHTLTVHGFNHIRGIGRDTSGNFYVADSFNSRILKFDRHMNPLCKTCGASAAYLDTPFGILVTSDHILVCSNRKTHICILNHDLDLLYKLILGFKTTDITVFDGKYFVTTTSSIISISDINFEDKKFTGHTELTIEGELELRGICASDQYLYVTQKSESHGFLLCLQFDAGHLKVIAKDEVSAPPGAVFYDGNTLFYSQGQWNEQFSIYTVTDDPENPLQKKKLFNV
jgi:hypothetical protein